MYPTHVRNVGFGTCSMIGRIGSILAPYAADLDTTELDWLPPILFGITGLIGGLTFLLLPEVGNDDLPETIDDIEVKKEFQEK